MKYKDNTLKRQRYQEMRRWELSWDQPDSNDKDVSHYYQTREKKLRGISRRLRAVRKWSEGFKNYFTTAHDLEQAFIHYPAGTFEWFGLPVPDALVGGRYSTNIIRAECAQYMINATACLIKAKPDFAKHYRINCRYYYEYPSESKIYIHADDEFYGSQTVPFKSDTASLSIIENRSLAEEWGLVLPPGVSERCIEVRDSHPDFPDSETYFWFGEVD